MEGREELRERLVAKFGTSISLAAESPALAELLDEIDVLSPHPRAMDDDDGYDKFYTEGYNKEDYSRSAYTKYDKTADEASAVAANGNGAADEAIVTRLREQLEVG